MAIGRDSNTDKYAHAFPADSNQDPDEHTAAHANTDSDTHFPPNDHALTRLDTAANQNFAQ